MEYVTLCDWMFDLTTPPLSLEEAVTFAVVCDYTESIDRMFDCSIDKIRVFTRLNVKAQKKVLNKLIKANLIEQIESEDKYMMMPLHFSDEELLTPVDDENENIEHRV